MSASAFHPSLHPSPLASSRRHLVGLLAALAAATGACTEDSASTSDETWQLPCASSTTISGYDEEGVLGAENTSYTYEGRHLIRTRSDSTVFNSYVRTQEWDGDHIVRTEYDDGRRHYEVVNTYDGGLKIRSVRHDLTGLRPELEGVWDRTYDHGVLVGERHVLPYARPDDVRITTITGADTPRSTWRDCWMSETFCVTYKYAHPPGDVDHWISMELDDDGDGFTDETQTQTYDDHALPLEWTRVRWGFLAATERFERDPDGTAYARHYEDHDQLLTWDEEFTFDCAPGTATARRVSAEPTTQQRSTALDVPHRPESRLLPVE